MISLKDLVDMVCTEAIEGKTVNPCFDDVHEVIYHPHIVELTKDNNPSYDNNQK